MLKRATDKNQYKNMTTKLYFVAIETDKDMFNAGRFTSRKTAVEFQSKIIALCTSLKSSRVMRCTGREILNSPQAVLSLAETL